ncbi:hypothetical protein FIV50_08620 [Microbacterium foliorum]|uniref:YobI-like P-loop NTPase domain-containing protein n=1 Tax=Microbacterium foliorum TaxID=104336 RepID=A0A4Y5YPR6_9MICO|nr:hypothetical protein [Microbacterium foliorum]QDE34851.1 hypothetical protein FIV50_08620 [Microbacterium foliorum]
MDVNEAPSADSSGSERARPLIPLTPDYNADRHGTYADALEQAIRGGEVSNVALAGSYGSGKSSILRSIVDRFPGQVVEVALSPLPASGATSEPDEGDFQKEIVKQLLYVVDPARARASKFPRASKDRWVRSIGWALGVGVVGVALQTIVAVAVVLLGGGQLTLDLAMSAATFIAVTALAFTFRVLTAGQWSIRDIKAGPTGLTISKEEVTYFDKYLDEIVYFFQLSKKRVVVFEDMDRFGGTEIFASLRALNLLLNNAAQLKPRLVFSALDRLRESRGGHRGQHRPLVDGPIVFIYAVRDSLIPVPTSSALEGADTDPFVRTKFFDLIVPVVPFVTPSNARETLTKEFESLGEHGVSSELRQAVAQYFPDLRQLRNIRNEFQIYRERLLRPGRSLDQLDPDRLFALIAYKNADPADFEMIRLGTSKLDHARDFAALLRAEHLAAVTARLEVPTADRLREHAARFGQTLASRCQVLGVSLSNFDTGVYFTEEQLTSLDVLRDIASETLRVGSNGSLMAVEVVEAVSGMSLNFARQTSSDGIELEREQLREEQTALEHATWRSLYDMAQYAYTANSGGDSRFASFDGYNFARYVHKRFGEGLVPGLISRNMLTRDFALLITEYAGQHISVTARSFVNGVLENPVRTVGASISGADVDQILQEYTEDILSRRGMVNVFVLDHLLAHRYSSADRVVRQLVQMTPEDETFLDAYFSNAVESGGADASRELVLALARSSGAILDYLARSAIFEPAQCLDLFGRALGVVRISTLSNSDLVAARVYAAQRQDEFKVLREAGQVAANAAAAVVRLGVTIQDVERLSMDARDVILQLRGFALTSHNLAVLNDVTPLGSLALDGLMHANRPLYDAVIERLDEYLALDGSQVDLSIKAAAGLLDVLTSLDDQIADNESARASLRAVAELASADVAVDDVRDLPPRVVDALFSTFRAAPSVRNLTEVTSAGRLPVSVAQFLVHERRVDSATATSGECSWLANRIVELATAHSDELPPKIVVEILGSFQLQEPLDISVIAKAPAALVAALTRAMYVSANELLSIVKPSSPWELREALLEQFPEGAWELAVPLVSTSDVPALLANRAISTGTKQEALQHVTFLFESTGGDTSAAADALVAFADRHGSRVLATDLAALASHTTEPVRILRIMLLDVNEDSWDLAFYILGELGEPYAAIFDLNLNSPKFPADKTHRRFLRRLEERGYVYQLPQKNGEEFLSVKRIR